MELTADTWACDTVMPRAMAKHIPIQPSLQSLSSMMYEVSLSRFADMGFESRFGG